MAADRAEKDCKRVGEGRYGGDGVLRNRGGWKRREMVAGGIELIWRRVGVKRNDGRWERRGMVAVGKQREWRVVEDNSGGRQ
jgi:hypothetical protein